MGPVQGRASRAGFIVEVQYGLGPHRESKVKVIWWPLTLALILGVGCNSGIFSSPTPTTAPPPGADRGM